MVPASCSCGDALLLARDDVAREHRQHRAVHRHRHRHLVERDAVEEDLHVLDRVDRDAGLADVADDARVVAVVAAVGGEVEGDRQAHLPGRRGSRGRRRSTPRRWRSRRTGGSSTAGSAYIVARGPRTNGSKPGSVADVLEALEVGRGVERLDVDALGRVPDQAVGVGPFSSLAASAFQSVDRRFRLFGHARQPTRWSPPAGKAHAENQPAGPVSRSRRGGARQLDLAPTTPVRVRWQADDLEGRVGAALGLGVADRRRSTEGPVGPGVGQRQRRTRSPQRGLGQQQRPAAIADPSVSTMTTSALEEQQHREVVVAAAAA